MPKLPTELLTQIGAALERYELEVRAAPLTQTTQDTYVLHAAHFVRWLADDFVPGSQLTGTRRAGGGL
jgi:hypothetical protein